MHLLGSVLVNFCVNLTGLRDAQRAGKTFLGVYFWKGLVFESVD